MLTIKADRQPINHIVTMGGVRTVPIPIIRCGNVSSLYIVFFEPAIGFCNLFNYIIINDMLCFDMESPKRFLPVLPYKTQDLVYETFYIK